MTRAGETLCGDWEERIRRDARQFAWRRLVLNLLSLALLLIIAVSALFGFGRRSEQPFLPQAGAPASANDDVVDEAQVQ